MAAMRVVAVFTAALPWLVAFGAAALCEDASAEKIAAGREFAGRACGTCHLVAQGGADDPARHRSAPNLSVVAQRQRVTEAALRKLLAANHHNFRASSAIPDHMVTDDQTEGLIAYALSLKSTD
jgi:mono/diheme cytochrome c family protein